MHNIRKAIIPAAGLGTRMLPLTKVVPKELLPLATKPIIQHIVEEISKAGFEEVILVTNPNKFPLAKHFSRDIEIERKVLKNSTNSFLKDLGQLSNMKIKISNAIQHKALGLGHAILCSKKFIKNEPFAVVLPDMVIDSNKKNSNLALMKKKFEASGNSSLLLDVAKKSEVSKYGIVKVKKLKDSLNSFFIEGIIEKPKPEDAPSKLFAAGRYIFNNEIFKFLLKERPDSQGEIQLTGAISNYVKENPLMGFSLNGKIHDCGNKENYLLANLEFSRKDKTLNKILKKYFR